MKIVSFKDIDQNKWDDFVKNHPHGNFFQTSYYYSLFKNFPDTKPFAYAVIYNDNIEGVILGVIYQNYKWPLNIVTRRAIVIGGPLIKDNNQGVFDFLMNEFCRCEKKNCTFIQLRNLWDIQFENFNFRGFGFIFEHHLNILNDISLDENVIVQKISKSKLANVRKSFNKGTLVEEIKNETDFKNGVSLILSTYEKIGLPCPPEDFFVNAFIKLSKNNFLKSLGAFVDGKIIAMRIEICYKNMIYDWYTGNLPEYNNRYPNDVLPYHILLWGKRNGYEVFDFGGAGKPDVHYGVRDHKLKFGGALVDFGRYERVNNKLFMILFKLGYLLIKKK